MNKHIPKTERAIAMMLACTVVLAACAVPPPRAAAPAQPTQAEATRSTPSAGQASAPTTAPAPADTIAAFQFEPELNMAPEAITYYTPGRFDGQKISVVLSAFFHGDGRATDKLKKEFEQLTGATVEYVPLPGDQLYDQVRLELVNNSGTYDIAHTGAGGAKDFGLSGFLVPLPKPPDVDDFYSADVAQYSIAAELYGLPMIADTNLLYWNTELFEKAGLDPNKPPQTYQEFRDYAIKLTTDKNGKHPGEDGFDLNNIEVYGAIYKGIPNLASTWEWYNYLYAFGGREFDDKYNPTLNSPEAVAALTWLADNLNKHHIYPADTVTLDYTEFDTLMQQGKAAMAINWPYLWSTLQDPKQSKVVGKIKVGRKPGEARRGGNIGGWSWNVFKMSKNPELAIAFAKWMSSPHAGLAFAEGGDGNPVRKSVASIWKAKDPQLLEAVNANLADGLGVGWLDTGPAWTEIENAQVAAIQAALTGKQDAQTALNEANEKIKAILDKNKFYTEMLPKLQGK